MVLEKVEMTKASLLPIIEKYRYSGTYTTHELSSARGSNSLPCGDVEVADFINNMATYYRHQKTEGNEDGGIANKILNKLNRGSLIISDVEWEERGNCVGDELFPVTMTYVALPDGRFFIEVNGFHIHEEYIVSIPSTSGQ